MKNKGIISGAVRSLGLLQAADYLRFQFQRVSNQSANRRFLAQNPAVLLPPDYLMYESFQLNYEKYFHEGRETAKWLIQQFSPFMDLQGKKVLDWGCGPARLLRHLPELLGPESEIHGTDYNPKSIRWNTENLPGIRFNLNKLEARLPYDSNSFDAIYGISIFTHLSESMHSEWYNELHRILKPGGLLLLTTQGDVFMEKLTPAEQTRYLQGQLVVRGKVKEGHRTYSAFHPAAYMQLLFSNADVLAHTSPMPERGKWLPQDIWIVRKNG